MMGNCNCKKKTVESSQTPVADPIEESYRQAFLRESRKTAELASGIAELQGICARLRQEVEEFARFVQGPKVG